MTVAMTSPENTIQPVGSFAVMRHRAGKKSSRFVAIHTEQITAEAHAKTLAAETVAQHATNFEFAFYVVEVVARIGFVDGKLEGAV